MNLLINVAAEWRRQAYGARLLLYVLPEDDRGAHKGQDHPGVWEGQVPVLLEEEVSEIPLSWDDSSAFDL